MSQYALIKTLERNTADHKLGLFVPFITQVVQIDSRTRRQSACSTDRPSAA